MMEDAGVISDADSDETIIDGSVTESSLEEALPRNRSSLMENNFVLSSENIVTEKSKRGEKLSPVIDLQIPKQAELISLTNETEESQSLLQAEINCLVPAIDVCHLDYSSAAIMHTEYRGVICLNSDVAGFLKTSDKNFPLNDEESPEKSLLSGMDALWASPLASTTTTCVGVSEIVLSNGIITSKEDRAEDHSSLEQMLSATTISKETSKKFEIKDFTDFDNLQMLNLLEYRDQVLFVDAAECKESNSLPEELLTALNSLSEPVKDTESQYITEEKQLTIGTDNDSTQITDQNVKQLHFQNFEDPETSTVTRSSRLLEISSDQNMHKLFNLDHQNTIVYNRSAEKEDTILNDASSHEQTVKDSSLMLKKSIQKRSDAAIPSCCNLKDMNQKPDCSAQTKLSPEPFEAAISDGKDKACEYSEMGTESCCCSPADRNTKIEQVRKSQRIANKTKRLAEDPVSDHNRIDKSQSQPQTKTRSGEKDSLYLSEKKQTAALDQSFCTTVTRRKKRNNKGETYLHLAAKKGDLSLVKSLIASGMSVNQKDNAGWAPIHEASFKGFTDIIAELLKAGADVNSKNLDGILPIHDAVSGSHFEAVKFLLLHGANPNEPHNNGKNALDEATCDKIKELLKSHGAIESKEIPSDRVDGGKKLYPSRARKKSICACYEKDSLVSKYSLAGPKCDTHEPISKILQTVQEKQERLSLCELRSQADADVYIQDLSEIQNVLNSVLAKQKSERDDLAKKYRASSESFKQGALRKQIAKLVGRQKCLLVMAQKQKELGQKLQNYKNAGLKSSSSSKQVPSIPASWEGSNMENGSSSDTASYPEVVGTETRHITEHVFLAHDLSQYLNWPEENEETNCQNEIGPQRLASENNLRAYSADRMDVDQVSLSSESTICSTLQPHLEENDHMPMTIGRNNISYSSLRTCSLSSSAAGSMGDDNSLYQPSPENNGCTFFQRPLHRYDTFKMPSVLDSTHKDLASHQTSISHKGILLNDNSDPAGIFSHALSQSEISQSSSQSSSNPGSGKKLNIKARGRKKTQLVDLLELGKIKPGEDVLEFTLQDFTHKASLLENGKIKTGNNSVYSNLLQWIKALLGNGISVSWKYVWNKVTYRGTLLSKMIAEVHIPQEKDLPLQQKMLFERSSTGSQWSADTEYGCSGPQATLIQEAAAPLSQENMEIPPSSVIQAKEACTDVTKTVSHPGSSSACRRILQCNSIMLIKDDELLPYHIMDQYWNFYLHCEKFGF